MVQTVDTTGLPIGLALKVERATAKVSLTAIAPLVGVSIGHLSHVEAGNRTASDELVQRIREAIATVVAERAA